MDVERFSRDDAAFATPDVYRLLEGEIACRPSAWRPGRHPAGRSTI